METAGIKPNRQMVRATLIAVLVVSLLALSAGYFGGRVWAASTGCAAIDKALVNHRETVYDPESDTVTVVAYSPDKGYEPATVSFNGGQALRECGKSQHIVSHVSQMRKDYQAMERAFCEDLKRVVAGEAPVPEKNGQPMNMEAARAYLAKRCNPGM